MSQDDPVQGMGEYPGDQGEAEPEVEPASSTQPVEASSGSEDPGEEDWPGLAAMEVESLKQELERHQQELDAVYARVDSIKRESDAEAEAVRREGEAKAQEIIQKANAEASLLELRARVRAEEVRAREVARLWSHLDSVLSAGKEGERVTEPIEEAVPPKEEPEEAPSAEMAEEAVEVEVEARPAAVEEPEPEWKEPDAGWNEPEGEESGSGLAEAVTAEAELAPEFVAQVSPEVRRFKVRGPLSFGSMVAIEQAAGRIQGVLSAKVTPSPDGGAVLAVSTVDSDAMEQGLRQIPHLSWQLEEL